MARPKSFDRDAALNAATRVFWAKGFAGASTEDLTQAMGIGRQSLYDTFGDKRRLYLEALERYNRDQTRDHVATLNGAAGAADGIERLLTAFASSPDAERHLGCFGINAICEFGQSDAEVAAARAGSSAAMSAALERLLIEGQAAGELDPAVDVAAAVAFINVSLAGMKVQAKAGATADELRRVAAFAVERLRPR